uniref:Chromosome 7 open reading frame 50 n=1 Tax=Chrysolophus pictus TaxID=9089 RepID=A0A8C3LUQ9_CHRPC
MKTKTRNAADEEEDLTPEERRKLERKLKKERKKEEKKLMREAGISTKKAEPKKLSGSELALAYLTSWSEKPKEWKFQKTRQTWLLSHMYEKEKVPDEHFTILLDYLQGLKGSARDTTVQKAEALMQELDGSDAEDPTVMEKYCLVLFFFTGRKCFAGGGSSWKGLCAASCIPWSKSVHCRTCCTCAVLCCAVGWVLAVKDYLGLAFVSCRKCTVKSCWCPEMRLDEKMKEMERENIKRDS